MKRLLNNRTLGLFLALALVTGVLATSAVAGLAHPIGENGLVCNEGTSFSLETSTGYVQTPDGNSILFWSYQLQGGEFQIPGPVLCVTEGEEVTVSLTNNLLEPSSIIFPGQVGVTTSGGSPGNLTAEATPSGGTVTYTFTPTEPGTYLYESGTFQNKQIQMGLYGALVVRPQLGGQYAYNDPSTEFEHEFLLLLSAIDPNLHNQVDKNLPYTPSNRKSHYWMINGRPSTDTLAPNGAFWLPSQPYGALVEIEAGASKPALIRYVNASTDNHPFHPHGNSMTVIGRDGQALGAATYENFSTTIGSGQTYDLLFRWDDVEGFNTTSATIPQNSNFPFPNVGNLVFKDDVTWYSGDAYLGQQGDLLPGVTSFNECGEFYFPWHSHALQEVQNFNEGFGGMLTLVRVDPPGGC